MARRSEVIKDGKLKKDGCKTFKMQARAFGLLVQVVAYLHPFVYLKPRPAYVSTRLDLFGFRREEESHSES
jgi:hypothetical protein